MGKGHDKSQKRRRSLHHEFDLDEMASGEVMRGRRRKKLTVDEKNTVLRNSGLLDAAKNTVVESTEGLTKGMVLEVQPGGAFVEIEGEAKWCVLRGKLDLLGTDTKNHITIGDLVYLERVPESSTQMGTNENSVPIEGIIRSVERRHTFFARKAGDGSRRIQAANIDQLAMVVSIREPILKAGLIDRYLIAADQGGLEPLIILNKIDLLEKEEDAADLAMIDVYRKLGSRVFPVSAIRRKGMAEVKEALIGKKSVLSGQSGVGKTSVLNAIFPGIDLFTMEVSPKTGKGLHSTSNSNVYFFKEGGCLIDTPGIKSFGLWGINKENIATFFKDFVPYLGQCKLSDCTHSHEPGCAIKTAVEQGEIARFRYEGFCRILDDLPRFSYEAD